MPFAAALILIRHLFPPRFADFHAIAMPPIPLIISAFDAAMILIFRALPLLHIVISPFHCSRRLLIFIFAFSLSLPLIAISRHLISSLIFSFAFSPPYFFARRYLLLLLRHFRYFAFRWISAADYAGVISRRYWLTISAIFAASAFILSFRHCFSPFRRSALSSPLVDIGCRFSPLSFSFRRFSPAASDAIFAIAFRWIYVCMIFRPLFIYAIFAGCLCLPYLFSCFDCFIRLISSLTPPCWAFFALFFAAAADMMMLLLIIAMLMPACFITLSFRLLFVAVIFAVDAGFSLLSSMLPIAPVSRYACCLRH